MNYCKKYQTTPIQQDKFKCLTKKCILFSFYGARTVLRKERTSFKIYKETLNNKWKGFQDQVQNAAQFHYGLDQNQAVTQHLL